MKARRLPGWILTLLVAAGLPGRAGALSVKSLTWLALVEHADLLGVLQCAEPGTNSAVFVVEDSWKGPANGTRLKLAVPFSPMYDGSRQVEFRPGERVLAAARDCSKKGDRRKKLQQPSATDGNVMLWFDVTADFETFLYQGFWKIENGGSSVPHGILMELATVSRLRNEAMLHLKLSPEQRELALLKQTLDQSVKSRYRGESEETVVLPTPVRDAIQSAGGAESVEQFFRALFPIHWREPDAWREYAGRWDRHFAATGKPYRGVFLAPVSSEGQMVLRDVIDTGGEFTVRALESPAFARPLLESWVGSVKARLRQ